MERTLILVKPDAFARNLTGEIIARFERKGLRLAALQQMTMTRELASQHYAEHEGKSFYEELVAFITSGPLVAMVLEGESAITAARQLIGSTNPLEANTGSIRGDYATSVGQNMVHGSDAPESAAREVSLFFPRPRLILASRSPQRQAILQQVGVRFEVHVTDAPELTEGPPEEVVLENAFRKARAAAQAIGTSDAPDAPEDTAVLGVDTIVALGPRIFGKPADREAARETLTQLAGREHTVLSGVCLISGDTTRTAAARTVVRFRPLDAAQIEAYVDTGEWQERAGGYAIQERGAMLVSGIEGDYLNVVGLPVATLVDLAPWLLGP